ncbi:amidase [Nocardia inohanensis]|uniref:amidase n=1 Tax=Nocardia inohanensis TaxID=209246 RepID=UPI0009FC200F|nr:amidase [Nocardia inohanensis]
MNPGDDRTVWREYGTPLVAATAAGPLSGQSVAVKDLYAVAGYAIGAGVRDYPEAVETRHAPVVAELLAAGADIAGIAQTDEFAYSITGGNGRYGMPVNPAAPDRIPGGSSSGSAVAVARSEATIGLGTDTAGSIRVPAAYQGLWGIRTTHGRIDRRGLLPLAPSFDAVGWLARDSETLEAVAAALMPEAEPREPDSLELVIDPGLCELADPEIADAVLSAGAALDAELVDLDTDPAAWFAAFRTVQAHEAWRGHGRWITEHPGALEPEVAQRFSVAATITESAATAARTIIDEAASSLRAALSGRVLLLPATATPPPRRIATVADLDAGRTRTLTLTCLASLAGLPALSVPLPRTAQAPIALSVVGPFGADHALIRVARRIAAAVGGSPAQPRRTQPAARL